MAFGQIFFTFIFSRPDLNSLGVRDREGMTPLNLALYRSSKGCAKLLVEARTAKNHLSSANSATQALNHQGLATHNHLGSATSQRLQQVPGCHLDVKKKEKHAI